MAWWSTSWLPLPSIDFSLPSGIQRRFISFILKRSLGHLLKPGQFDVQQIDSQIGSGYVQVRDLELDYTVRFSFSFPCESLVFMLVTGYQLASYRAASKASRWLYIQCHCAYSLA